MTYSPFKKSVLSLAIGIASLPVFAQQIEEITVTAEFREANVQATPIAITAITGDMLEARGQSNLVEIASQAPNVSLKPAGPATSGMIAYIRGIGQLDFDAAVEPGVGVYVDDVYYAQLTGSLLDLLDVDRVEVLRGPQGTLNGRNSIGGAIKLYTRQPGADGNGGNLALTYGAYDMKEVRGSADIELVPGSLYARIAGASRDRDGYVDDLDYACVMPNSGLARVTSRSDCVIDENGEQTYTTGRLNLRWVPNDDLQVSLAGDYLNDTSGAAPGTLLYGDRSIIESLTNADGSPASPSISGDDGDPATPPVYYRNHLFVATGANRNTALPFDDPYVNFATRTDPNGGQIVAAGDPPIRIPVPWKPVSFPSLNTLEHWGGSLRLDWSINDDLELVAISGYREYDKHWTVDSDYSPLALTMLDNNQDHWQFTQELRLNGSTDDLDWTVGGFYLDQSTSYEARITFPYALLDFHHGPDKVPADTLASFINGTWHLNDRLDLSAGLRYSEERKDYTHRRRNPDLSPIAADVAGPTDPLFPINIRVAGIDGLQATFKDHVTDWRVALDYQLNDSVMTYASASTGYKSGGINSRPFFPQQLQTFSPETLTAYELGVKSTLLDNTLRLNTAVFYNEYDDIQLLLNACEVPTFVNPTGFGAPCAKPANVGNGEIKGVEAEAEWYVGDGLLIDASVSTLDFDYTSVDPVALVGSTIAPLDMVTPYTPELAWSLGAQYGWTNAMGDWHVRVDASYQDDVYADPTNGPTNRIDSYTLGNARLWWDSPDQTWEVALDVQNIGDKLYYLTKLDQSRSVGQVTGQPGMPRTWQVSARRQF